MPLDLGVTTRVVVQEWGAVPCAQKATREWPGADFGLIFSVCLRKFPIELAAPIVRAYGLHPGLAAPDVKRRG